jgi:hypothetical protein
LKRAFGAFAARCISQSTFEQQFLHLRKEEMTHTKSFFSKSLFLAVKLYFSVPAATKDEKLKR